MKNCGKIEGRIVKPYTFYELFNKESHLEFFINKLPLKRRILTGICITNTMRNFSDARYPTSRKV